MARILDQVIGHDKQTSNLLAAISQKRLPPGLIFVGPPGVGKSLTAKGLAQAVLCEESSQACGACPSCLRVEKNQSESFLTIEPQGTQIKIEQARSIQDFLSLRMLGKARIILINDAHLLTPQSANALLKTLEEPPEQTHFFLISPTSASLLPTIRSRCQSVFFSPIDYELLKSHTGSKDWMLRASQGRFDQLERLQDNELDELRSTSVKLFHSIVENRRFDAFSVIRETVKDRSKALFVVECWQQLLRDIWYTKNNLSPLINQDFADFLKSFQDLDTETLDSATQAAFQLEKDVLRNVDRGLAFENFWIHLRNSLERNQLNG